MKNPNIRLPGQKTIFTLKDNYNIKNLCEKVEAMGKEEFKIEKKEGKSFYFIGVTTTKSSIMKLFPLWMD